MSEQSRRFDAYRDLDASVELDASVAWLDRVGALEPIRHGKQRSCELLDLGLGDRVLDVGCGTGVDIPALARLVGPGGAVVGVDLSQGVLAAAARVAANAGIAARFEQVDAAELPFDDAAFDACRCDRTVQHLPDPGAAIGEMARVTRPGGRLVISETRNHIVESEGHGSEVLGRILSLAQLRAEGALWIGFRLPWLMGQAGVTEVAIESVKGTLGDADDIAAFYDLAHLTEHGVATGQIEAAEALALHEAVQREACSGHLTVVLETHIFFGRIAP